MAWYLYRLGRWSFRRRRTVIAAWLALLVAGLVGAATLSGDTDDSFSLPDIESSQAFDLIEQRTGESADGAIGRLAVEAPDGTQVTDADAMAAIEAALQTATTDHVASIADPYTSGTVSADGSALYAVITYDRTGMELSDADRDAVADAVDQLTEAGFTAAVGGDAATGVEIGHTAEVIGVAIAFVVLLLTFGSLIAAGMPLLTALVGVGLGVLGVTTMTGFITLSSLTPALASMLGLAVGIDYALFIMSRFKHEVGVGRSHEEAAGVAVGTAGSAVVFAGLTVVIALVGLTVPGISFLTQMGLAAAATVAVAVAVALTLLPALLSLAGRRVVSGRIPGLRQRDPESGSNGLGRRWADFITRFRVPTLVVGLGIAAVLSVPVASLQLALPDDGVQPKDSDPRQAYDMVAEHFGDGANGPLTVVIDVADSTDPTGAVDAAVAEISSISTDIAAVIPPVADPSDAAAVAAFEGQLDQAGFATITVVPESGPSDRATQDLVGDIRDRLSDLESQFDATPYVTGQTALGVDIAETLAEAFPVYLAIVVGLAFILLVLVFRSLLVPIKATLGFLASVGIALGVTVAVYQWGWLAGLVGVDAQAPVLFILPLLLTGILFGLAMDYEVFLVSRMREEYVHGMGAREAVVVGFSHSARVVTAAAAIMTGVFVGFAIGDDVMIKAIGFSLAVGIVADAFLVRMTLVPALMALAGSRMWWLPKWLDRIVPNVDIEGESLMRKLSATASATASDNVGPAEGTK